MESDFDELDLEELKSLDSPLLFDPPPNMQMEEYRSFSFGLPTYTLPNLEENWINMNNCQPHPSAFNSVPLSSSSCRMGTSEQDPLSSFNYGLRFSYPPSHSPSSLSQCAGLPPSVTAPSCRNSGDDCMQRATPVFQTLDIAATACSIGGSSSSNNGCSMISQQRLSDVDIHLPTSSDVKKKAGRRGRRPAAMNDAEPVSNASCLLCECHVYYYYYYTVIFKL
jgi:hypothetical protein